MQKSLRLVLQSKSTYDENWIDRIEIVQENGAYHLDTRYEEIFLLKKTIAKDGYPIVVYSVSNFSVARKRNISLYTGNTDEIDRLLLFRSNYYIKGFDFLDIDPLATRYHFFYQFNNLSVITKKHLELLPESRSPFRL